jgi:hypothetical protein
MSSTWSGVQDGSNVFACFQQVRWYIRWYVANVDGTDTNMRLSDLALKQAKPGPKIIKLSDGGGLQLWITPDGAKRWRFAYRFGGAQKVLAIGVYPTVGLKEARQSRDAARQDLA